MPSVLKSSMLTQLKRLKSFLITTCVVVPSALTFVIICYSADNQRAELMELGVFCFDVNSPK